MLSCALTLSHTMQFHNILLAKYEIRTQVLHHIVTTSDPVSFSHSVENTAPLLVSLSTDCPQGIEMWSGYYVSSAFW